MFRFTIREVLLATLIVALVLGWGLERYQVVRLQTEVQTLQWKPSKLEDALKSEGYKIVETKDGLQVSGKGSTYEYYHPNFVGPADSN